MYDAYPTFLVTSLVAKPWWFHVFFKSFAILQDVFFSISSNFQANPGFALLPMFSPMFSQALLPYPTTGGLRSSPAAGSAWPTASRSPRAARSHRRRRRRGSPRTVRPRGWTPAEIGWTQLGFTRPGKQSQKTMERSTIFHG